MMLRSHGHGLCIRTKEETFMNSRSRGSSNAGCILMAGAIEINRVRKVLTDFAYCDVFTESKLLF